MELEKGLGGLSDGCQCLWAGYGGSRAKLVSGEQGAAEMNINGSCITGYDK